MEAQAFVIQRHIDEWKSTQDSPLFVIVGRGNKTGALHCEMLRKMLHANSRPNVKILHGYWPDDIVNMMIPDNANVLMISMGVVTSGYLPPGEIYLPERIIQSIDTNWNVTPVNIPVNNAAHTIVPEFQKINVAHLEGILN